MDRDTFKLIHSELIQQVQCTEFNLKRIYSAMKNGDFNDNFDDLKNSNLGVIARKLKDLDYSDNFPEFTKEEYKTIDDIRKIRNYWCHQCYLDYIYIQNDNEREIRFQEIANRLHYDELRTYDLFKKTESMYKYVLRKYR